MFSIQWHIRKWIRAWPQAHGHVFNGDPMLCSSDTIYLLTKTPTENTQKCQVQVFSPQTSDVPSRTLSQ